MNIHYTSTDFGLGKSSTEEIVKDEVDRFLIFLKQKEGKPFLVQGVFNLPVLNVFWYFCAGQRYEYDDPKLVHLLTNVDKLLRVLDSGRASSLLHLTLPACIFRLFPKFLDRHVPIEVFAMIRDFLSNTIEEHSGAVNEENPKDFIEAFIAEISNTTDLDSSFYGSYGKKNLLETLVDLLVAGSETTSTTLTWGMLYMIRYPDVQQKVQQELDSMIGRSCSPMYSDRSRLPYTEATIMEIHRCANINPMQIFHYNCEDIEVNGMRIPANTMISPLMSEILKGDHWGEDKDMFRPERFLDQNGELVVDEHLIPFGIGRRHCPGESLAKIELFQFFTGKNIFSLFHRNNVPKLKFQGTRIVKFLEELLKVLANSTQNLRYLNLTFSDKV